MGASNSKPLTQELNELLKFLKAYCLNPIEGIRSAPELSWPAILSLQAGIAMTSGVVFGLVNLSFLDFLLGILVFPISSVAATAIFSLFLLYFFSLLHSTYLDFLRLFTLVTLSSLPHFVLHTLSGFIPPIDLIGFAFTGILLTVGLVENFGLNKRVVMRLLGALYVVYFLIWILSQIQSANNSQEIKRLNSPKSLDALESEVKDP